MKGKIVSAIMLTLLLTSLLMLAFNVQPVQTTGTVNVASVDWWPMFHHDLNHTGYSTSTAPDTNNTIWSYTTGGGVYSSPAVADGKLYVGSHDYKVYCLNASTGSHIWDYTTGGYVASSPAVADGKVYVGSQDGKVYCLDAATGSLIWSYTTTGSYVFSSPAVSDGKVYVDSYVTQDKKVYCLDAATGAFIWSYTTGASMWSSPAVADGKVYVGSQEDGKVYCLDAATGASIWNYTTGDYVYSSPAVADGKVYVGSQDGKVYCLDAATGAFIWSYTRGDPGHSSPAVADGKVYVGSDGTKVYCLNASTGSHIWDYTTGDSVYSSPAVADGKVYIGSYDKKVYAFGPPTHDVAVTSVTPSKAVVGQGCSLNMHVTAANQGDCTETFNVMLYANETIIQTQPVTLESSVSTTITFTWNTAGWAKGNYTISAYAEPVPGEIDTDDNTKVGGFIWIGVPCDVTGPNPGVPDGICNMRDIGFICAYFEAQPGDPRWEQVECRNCDVNNDGVVNMRDIGMACDNFGKTD